MPVPCAARRISLHFRSPVSIRQGNKMVVNARSILLSLRRRIAMLAPWQSLELCADDTFDNEVRKAVPDERQLSIFHWQRYSKNSGNTPIPMQGYLGRMNVSGQLVQTAKYCKIAEQVNTASHAGLGLGWFDASLYP